MQINTSAHTERPWGSCWPLRSTRYPRVRCKKFTNVARAARWEAHLAAQVTQMQCCCAMSEKQRHAMFVNQGTLTDMTNM